MKKHLRKYLALFFLIIFFIINFSICTKAAQAVTITKQPKNSSYYSGERVNITVSATGKGLKYQWWIKNSGSKKFAKSSITGNKYITTMKSKLSGRKLYCVVTDKYGNKKTSKPVTITIKKGLVITKQPSSTKLYKGEKTNISFNVKGEGLNYQWWIKNSGSKKFYKSSIKTSNYVTEVTQSSNNRKLYCVVTDKFGCKTVSDTVAIRMKNPAVILKQPKSANYKNGSKTYISLNAQGDGLNYQWWVKNTNNSKFYKSSIKSAKYVTTINPEKNGRKLYCVVTDTYENSVKSEIITLNMLKNTTCKTHSFSEEAPTCYSNGKYKFEKNCKICGAVDSVYYDAVITFVDDDAKADALYNWERIMDTTGIKITSAVIPSKATEKTEYEGYYSYAGWDDILRLKAKGMDFVNHTYNHKKLTTLTAEEIREDFEAAKDALSLKGINSDILVYPNNAYNDTVLSVAHEFFKTAVTCDGYINKFPFENSYTLSRVNLNTSKITKDIKFGKDTVTCDGVRTLDELKKYAQSAHKNNGWLVFMAHAYNSPAGKTYFDKDAEKTIINFCNYVKKLGTIKFITLTEGVNITNAYK